MNLQEQIKMAAFISRREGDAFDWGKNDCNTFFIEMHDYVYGTQDMLKIQHQYGTRRGAIEFMRRLKLSPAQWLFLRGYRKMTEPGFINGDVVIHDHKVYATVFVYFEGVFWSVQENTECQAYTVAAVTAQPHQGWRK